MTWSPNASGGAPRGVTRGAGSGAPAPVAWTPAELALDTRSLHASIARTQEHEPMAAEPLPSFDVQGAVDDAYARGFEEGRLAGERAEATRLHSAVAAARDALASVEAEGDRWLANIESNLCALAVAVARQIIGREIAADKSSLGDMVQRALTEFPLDQPLTVRVNPADLAAITSALAALGEGTAARPRDVQWVADPRIAAGGCLLEGRDRIIDGRVDTALERLYRRLSHSGA